MPLLGILEAELRRNFAVLRQGATPAYFIGYAVHDERSAQIVASLGALTRSDESMLWSAMFLDVDLDGEVDSDVTQLTGAPTPHPLYASGGANDTYDVAVFLLDDEQSSITPAPLPAANLLNDKQLKNATFTTVGYGTERDSKNGGVNSFLPGSRRKVVEQSINSVNKAWVTLSMNPSTGNGGTCYGDSGGPHFLGGKNVTNKTIVSITVTGDRYCRSTDKTYRLDTRSARDFLGEFVELP